MFDTMTRYLGGLSDNSDSYALRRILLPLVDRLSSQPLTSAGLVINAAGALFPKIGAANFYACAAGVLVELLAGAALPAPPSSVVITANYYNVVAYFLSNAGVVTALGGTQAPTLAGVGFPQPIQGNALIGLLILTNAGGFTGGTTALDNGTTVYISPLGPFDPTMLV